MDEADRLLAQQGLPAAAVQLVQKLGNRSTQNWSRMLRVPTAGMQPEARDQEHTVVRGVSGADATRSQGLRRMRVALSVRVDAAGGPGLLVLGPLERVGVGSPVLLVLGPLEGVTVAHVRVRRGDGVGPRRCRVGTLQKWNQMGFKETLLLQTPPLPMWESRRAVTDLGNAHKPLRASMEHPLKCILKARAHWCTCEKRLLCPWAGRLVLPP